MESIYAIKSASGEIFGLTTDYDAASSGLNGLNPQYVMAGFPFTLISFDVNITEIRQNSGGADNSGGSIEVSPVETIPDPNPTEDTITETPKEAV